MTTPLLATRLYIPPVPYQLVYRVELVNRMDESLRLGRRLTLITAPPGYGKTSLITHWVSNHRQPAALKFCWLSLDESDNDPTQFWTYVLATLQTCQEKLGESLAQSIWAQPNSAVMKSFLINLINEITTLDDKLVLVLDDFQIIQNEVLLNQLIFLIEHLSAHLHLVLLSRTVPPLPLSRWRSWDQITELYQNDLRFTQAETQAFLSARVAGISSTDVRIIHERLEGWPSGLQLTAFAIGSHLQDEDAYRVDTVTGSPVHAKDRVFRLLSQAQPFLIEYLTDEVLNHLPEPIQAFLLRTSILERLCPPLCDSVMGKTSFPHLDYRVLVSQLEKQNLFLIPLDPERKWYRYQHLFGELLQARLIDQVPANEIQELHRDAATWYHQQGFGVEAIHHALLGNDLQTALEWAEQLAPDLMNSGRANAFLTLIGNFPPASLDSRPRLSLYQTRALLVSGQYGLAWDQVHSLEPHIQFAGDLLLVTELATLKALLATFTRPSAETIQFAKAALVVLPMSDLVSRARMHLILGAMHRLEARLSDAADEILEAQRLAKQAGQTYLENTTFENLAALRMQAGDYSGAEKILRKTVISGIGSGFGQVCMAAIQFEWDHMSDTEAYLTEGLRLGEKSGVMDVMVNGYLCLFQLRWAQGDRKAAVEAFNDANELAQASSGSLWRPMVAIERRWLELKLQDSPDFAILIEKRGHHSDADLPQPKYFRLRDQLVSARVFLADGDWQEALALAQSIAIECETAGLIRLLVESVLLKALIFEAMGDPVQALSETIRAIRTAAPDGFVRVFVNEGEPVRRLLEQCASRIVPKEVSTLQQLLSHFPSRVAGVTETGRPGTGMRSQPSPFQMVEPLTVREKEVLELIAAGCTNRQIADRLVTTENTVKKHTSHILGKLMVSNRTQALVKARELGIIS